jgi:S1-C subfamily serine protease
VARHVDKVTGQKRGEGGQAAVAGPVGADHGAVERGRHGLVAGVPRHQDSQAAIDLADEAAAIAGSVIVALDNQPVRSPTELTRLVTGGPVGKPVTLQYILPGGEQRKAEVSLQSLEVPLERALVGPQE